MRISGHTERTLSRRCGVTESILPTIPPWDWYKEDDTLELFNRAGIDHIQHSSVVWLPDPYAVETAVKVKRELLGAKD